MGWGMRGAGVRRRKLGATGGHDQLIDGEHPGFAVEGELESLDEQILKHQPQLGGRYGIAGFGEDVVSVGRDVRR